MDFQEICIFEDEGYKNLLPLTYMRPAWGLRCGMTVLVEKILRAFPKAPYSLHCREYLVPSLRGSIGASINNISTKESCLFINGRLLPKDDLLKKLVFKAEDEVLTSGDSVVAARLSGKNLDFIKRSMAHALSMIDFEPLKLDLRFRQTDIALLTYPWDLVHENPSQIKDDFAKIIKNGSIKGDVHPSAVIYEKGAVSIGEGSEIMAGVVLDARKGPIYIGKGVEVQPHTRIEGPCYIGDKTRLLGGKIREGCSIGPVCKVGGELEETIIQGYSNKQHDGFLGHSYVCEWINLGAGTTNSDLKNNYGSVKVWIDNTEVDSKSTFVGSFIGDHTKTGIGTLLNTGTVIGVAANIFGGGLMPKLVPSFAWGGNLGLTEHRLEDAIKTAKAVMDRRGIAMNSADEALMRKAYELTKNDRATRLTSSSGMEI